jgi:quercetin dioxygenase-like cupin family protein
MSKFAHLTTADSFKIVPGVTARPLFGDAAMLNLVDIEPGAGIPPHSHPHEQLGFVLEGELHLSVNGVDHALGPGDAFQLPGGTEHAAAAGSQGCRLLDVFHPVREDYRDRVAE